MHLKSTSFHDRRMTTEYQDCPGFTAQVLLFYCFYCISYINHNYNKISQIDWLSTVPI